MGKTELTHSERTQAEGTREQPGKGNVFSVEPGSPFLATLAKSLIEGEIVAGFRPVDEPSCLSDCTIFLPTRRAARALALEIHSSMQELTGRQATVLPKIRTLGDTEEEEGLPGYYPAHTIDVDTLGIGRVTDPVERRLTLAVLARKWITAISGHQLALLDGEAIALPSSASDAIRVANDLAEFMDQVETEEIDWTAFAGIVPEDENYAQWWQLTHRFLSIIMDDWPNIIAEKGEIGPSAHRTELARFRGEALLRGAFDGPVIAAGSTGSIPSTARLIKIISCLDNGAVVLPGADTNLPPEISRCLGNPVNIPPTISFVPTHNSESENCWADWGFHPARFGFWASRMQLL